MSLLELEAMGNLMRTAMQIAKRKDAFLEYEELLYLQDANGTELGQREHSRKTAKEMIKVATRVGREEIRLFLTTTNPIMNHKPHLCVKADKATDNDANQFEMINGRMNYLGSPVTSSLGLPLIDGEYTGADDPDSDEKEAGSGVCFNKILEVLEDYGVILIDKNNKSVYEWKDFPGVGLGISEQARSAVFDGEYCYQGKPGGNGEKNVKFLFKDPVRGYGDATFLVTHDAPHATDLLKGDGLNANSSDYTRETVHKLPRRPFRISREVLIDVAGFVLSRRSGASSRSSSITYSRSALSPRRCSFSRISSPTCPLSSCTCVTRSRPTTQALR
jgi:hypothetical protein